MLKPLLLSIPRERLMDLVFYEIYQTVLYITKFKLKFQHVIFVIKSDINLDGVCLYAREEWFDGGRVILIGAIGILHCCKCLGNDK